MNVNSRPAAFGPTTRCPATHSRVAPSASLHTAPDGVPGRLLAWPFSSLPAALPLSVPLSLEAGLLLGAP